MDHVLPVALYDAAESTSAWRPSIPVHRVCHERKNKRSEQVAILMHKLFTETDGNVQGRNWMKRVASLPLQLGTVIDDETGETLQRVTGFSAAYEAAWTWVRGMHAILYGQFLPPASNHMTYPPMGGMYIPPANARGRKQRTPIGIEEVERRRMMFLNAINLALHRHQFDGLRFWGNRCGYVATWITNKKRKQSRCIWALQYDGTAKYSAGTPFVPTPWLGWYDCVRAPVQRTELR